MRACVVKPLDRRTAGHFAAASSDQV